MEYICNRILLRHKEQNLANCDMFWSWGYYAKWSKSDRERQILYDFLYVELKTNKKQKPEKPSS